MTILLFFAVLFVLILVHEWGHYITAKKTGMQVDEFGIGFPPKLFGWRRGETEYTFNLFPIGGFVRILGENMEEGGASEHNERAFSARPKWAQAVVLVAGVTMNIIFAWLLYVIVFMVGVPTAIEESAASPESRLVVSQVLAEAPAGEAGLPLGAEILSVENQAGVVAGLLPSEVSTFIAAAETVTLTYQVGETAEVKTITPQPGVVEIDPDRPAIGVAFVLVEDVQKSFVTAVHDGFVTTLETLAAVTVGLTQLIIDSFRGTADFSQVAGPVGIVGMVGDAAQFGLTSLLLFTAVISLNLAVINMLPFPALDGGRLLFVGIEAITRRPIKPVWVMRLNTIGFFLLITLMVVVTYNDILKLL